MRVAAALLLWTATAIRLVSFRRAPSFINGSYAVAALAVATGLTLTLVDEPLDGWAGPYVSDLVEHGVIVVGGVAAQLFLLALRTGRPTGRQTAARMALAAVVLVVMVATFASAPIHQSDAGDLDEVYGDTAPVATYRLTFHGYLIYVLTDNVRLCLRYANAPGDRGRSLGLALVGWGSAICLGYPLSRVAALLLEQTGSGGAEALQSIGSLASILGLCCLASGVLAPRTSRSVRRWQEARRGARRLAPLWKDLVAAFPLVALPTNAPLTVRRAELRYDRRLLEVADALARARVDERAARRAVHRIDEAAEVLLCDRQRWAARDGAVAADMLPPALTAEAERSHLLALADAYRRLSTCATRHRNQEAST